MDYKHDFSDTELDTFVPEHVRDNYRRVVGEQYGGDWQALADTMHGRAADERHHGERALAAWARKQAAEQVSDGSETPPVKRGRPAKNTAAGS